VNPRHLPYSWSSIGHDGCQWVCMEAPCIDTCVFCRAGCNPLRDCAAGRPCRSNGQGAPPLWRPGLCQVPISAASRISYAGRSLCLSGRTDEGNWSCSRGRIIVCRAIARAGLYMLDTQGFERMTLRTFCYVCMDVWLALHVLFVQIAAASILVCKASIIRYY
jgi:hypothetical protein